MNVASATQNNSSRLAGASRQDRPPLWVSTVVIIGALGVASLTYGAMFGPQTILGHGEQMNAAARVWAHYAAAYDLPLAIALVTFLAMRAYRMLTGTLMQAVGAEALLAIAGAANHRWEQIPADVVIIAGFTLVAWKLRGYQSTR
jgi:hypothetical protein